MFTRRSGAVVEPSPAAAGAKPAPAAASRKRPARPSGPPGPATTGRDARKAFKAREGAPAETIDFTADDSDDGGVGGGTGEERPLSGSAGLTGDANSGEGARAVSAAGVARRSSRQAKNVRADPNEVLLTFPSHGRGAVALTRADIARLGGPEALSLGLGGSSGLAAVAAGSDRGTFVLDGEHLRFNDNLVDFWLKYVELETLGAGGFGGGSGVLAARLASERSLFLNTFFMKRVRKAHATNLQRARETGQSRTSLAHTLATKRLRAQLLRLFQSDFVYIPVHEERLGGHWTLAIICFPALAISKAAGEGALPPSLVTTVREMQQDPLRRESGAAAGTSGPTAGIGISGGTSEENSKVASGGDGGGGEGGGGGGGGSAQVHVVPPLLPLIATVAQRQE
ncbi:hypothetical protein T492DRAFT_108006 [Pavlovales sp. CCMP2436]|nr:hypothetical protein T492DRAFT_108006 [Pavlovales sp. CCMP2436]